MEHTHCWDVQEGEGQISEGRSRRSTQNRRDPGGWASLYRHPRSNRENCCQVHLSPFIIINGSFRGHVITDRKDWSGNSITRNAFSVIFQLSTLFQKFLPYCDLTFDHILWFLGLFSNLEETHVRLLGLIPVQTEVLALISFLSKRISLVIFFLVGLKADVRHQVMGFDYRADRANYW